MLSRPSLAQCWSWASHHQVRLRPVHRSPRLLAPTPYCPPSLRPYSSLPSLPPTPRPPPIPPPPPICPAHRKLHLAHHDHDLPPALYLADMLQVPTHRNCRAVGLLPLNVLVGGRGTRGHQGWLS